MTDRSLAVWSVSTGVRLASLPNSDVGYGRAAFSPDGRWLATAELFNTNLYGGKARLWDATTWAEARLEGAEAPQFNDLAFSPDTRFLAGASISDGTMIWQLPEGKLRRVLTGHTGSIRAVAFSPDGTSIASAGEDMTVRTWSAAQGEANRVIHGHTGGVLAVAFSPDGERLISGGQDGQARIWDLTVDPDVGDFVDRQGQGSNVEAIAYAEGGRQIVTFNRAGWVSRSESESQASIDVIGTDAGVGWLTPAEPACFDAEGRRLLAMGSDRREALCIDVRGGRRIVFHGHTLAIRWTTLSADGTRAATAALARPSPSGLRGEVIVWNTADGRPLFRWESARDQPRRVALDATGRRMALSAVRDGVGPWRDEANAVPFLAVFDIDTGRELFRQDPVSDQCWAIAFSPDGRRLASAAQHR
jgi:WD40 repeat protein